MQEVNERKLKKKLLKVHHQLQRHKQRQYLTGCENRLNCRWRWTTGNAHAFYFAFVFHLIIPSSVSSVSSTVLTVFLSKRFSMEKMKVMMMTRGCRECLDADTLHSRIRMPCQQRHLKWLRVSFPYTLNSIFPRKVSVAKISLRLFFKIVCRVSAVSANSVTTLHVMWCDYKERQRIYNMAVESWQQERCRIKSDTFLLLLSLISCFCPQIIIQLPLQSCRTKRFIVSSLVCLLVKAIPFVRDRKRIFSWHARNGIIFRLSRDPFQNVPLRQAKLQNDINTNLERQERWQQLTHDEDDGASFL